MKFNAKNIIVYVLFLFSMQLHAQWTQDLLNGDTAKYSLLINPFIEVESTEAINAMYNFEFKKADSHFTYLEKNYPWHPLPYLLKGLNYWWQIVPNYENTTYDEPFLDYMDKTKVLAENVYEKYNEIEGAFFLAAAYAFEGRLYSERREYRKAAVAGARALKYLEECKGHETYSPELLFGDALFNYYGEWIRDEYPLLRPVMVLFPKGDMKLGIEQLKEVSRNAFYSRTEAQFYLMRVLASGPNKDLREAVRVGKMLHRDYPDNPYFHRYYTRLLYQSGNYKEAETKALEILAKIASDQAGYEANSGRYAGFFLGHIYELRQKYDQAKKYYQVGMEYAEQVNATNMGYYFYSLLHLGTIAVKEGDKELAKDYYKQVKKAAKRSHPTHKSARERLKKL